jgi:hypothetical protein
VLIAPLGANKLHRVSVARRPAPDTTTGRVAIMKRARLLSPPGVQGWVSSSSPEPLFVPLDHRTVEAHQSVLFQKQTKAIVASLRCQIVPPVHCVPGTPGPRSPPTVPVPLHWLSRYGYAAGSLRDGGPLAPARSARTRTSTLVLPVRIRGWLPWRPADSWPPFAAARTRASTLVLPVRIRSWLSLRAAERRV